MPDQAKSLKEMQGAVCYQTAHWILTTFQYFSLVQYIYWLIGKDFIKEI